MHLVCVPSRMRTILLVLLALTVAGCTGGEPTSATPAPTPAATATPVAPTTRTPTATPTPAAPPVTSVDVAIRDFSFQPADVSVALGTEVVWTNADQSGHTVTAEDGSFNSGNLRAQGTFVRRFDATGTFAYRCAFHPDMTGTVTVA